MESQHVIAAAQPDETGLSPITFCGRCGKRLHGTQAIARGYGPHCWAIVTGQKAPPPGKRPHFAHSRLLQTTERA